MSVYSLIVSEFVNPLSV